VQSIQAFIGARSWGLALVAGAALLGATAAIAADGVTVADAQSVYQKERAACLNGATNQDRATCLKEAGAALQASKRGGLDDGQAQVEQNRLLRCDGQPPEERQNCVRRMSGEGATTGSVEAGGIYRELVTPDVPPQRN
jgi:pyocin large subunit-like protein